MAQNSVKATLVLRNDTAANWASRNPILAKGEIGAEIDTGLLKLGDGVTSFNSLTYINGNGQGGDGVLVTNVNNKLTVANYGYSYWEYDTFNLEEVEVIEPDLSKWPEHLELEMKNGEARWVKPIGTYNKIEGKIDGVFITLAADPQYNNDAATKHYVDTKVTNSLSNLDQLKRQVVTELPVNPVNNTIYMIKDNNATGADKYKEYLVIDGVLTQIGDTSVDLSNYVQKVANATANNLAKLAVDGSLIDSGIAAGPATSLNLGFVRASNGDNYINVDNLGQMYLNRVATDKLYVPLGSEFILNGGSA